MQQRTERRARTAPEVVAVIGASGFVGRLIVPALALRCRELRCLSRDPARLPERLPERAVRVRADLLEPSSLEPALRGADAVFYLAHSLGESDAFDRTEAEAARNLAEVAARSGLRRIVYLGALAQLPRGAAEGSPHAVREGSPHVVSESSPHVASRHRVGEILRAGGVPVSELRASVVIGAGSMPFEVVRALVERLPVMITPRWVRMPIQPIAESDLVRYLLAALDEPGDASPIYEIGGASVASYAELMRSYARARGLRRLMLPVPVVTPRLSSLWLKLVTPAHFALGRRIVASAEHPSVVADDTAERRFAIAPMALDEAVRTALASEALRLSEPELDAAAPVPEHEARLVGTRFFERRSTFVAVEPEDCFEAIGRIGGERGWYWGDWLWRLRGALDRLVGGPGLRRRARPSNPPRAGEPLDFWTVARCDPGRRLVLRADMRLPGEAWLDLRVRPVAGGCRIEQVASFDARGLLGILYWTLLRPLHSLVFTGMLRGIAAAAARGVSAEPMP